MKIEHIDYGFIETFENDTVEKIVCRYNGTCTVYFYDKPPRELTVECGYFNSQYGIPISKDGTKIFVGSWENGLCAYDIISGKMLWRFKPGKIRNIFVYSKFLIISRAYTSVVKIDIDTGEMLASIRSGTIRNIFDLEDTYIFADTISGKHSIIDIEKMVVVKKYAPKIINPLGCLSLIVTNVALQHDILTICGIEEYPQKNFDPKVLTGTHFSRIIDTKFSEYIG